MSWATHGILTHLIFESFGKVRISFPALLTGNEVGIIMEMKDDDDGGGGGGGWGGGGVVGGGDGGWNCLVVGGFGGGGGFDGGGDGSGVGVFRQTDVDGCSWWYFVVYIQ